MISGLHYSNNILFRTTISSFFFMIAHTISAPFITPYLLSVGFSESQVSYSMAFAPLVLVLLSTIIGQISDVIGRKRLLNLSLVTLALSYVGYIFIGNNIALLVALSCLSAVGYDAFLSAALSRVEDKVKSGRGFITALYETIRSVGAFLGALLGSYLITISDYSSVLKLSLFIIIVLFVFSLFRRSHNHNKVDIKKLSFVGDIKKYLSIKGLAGIAIIGFAVNSASALTTIFIPVLITKDLNSSASYIGIYAAIISFSRLSQFYWGGRCTMKNNKNIIIFSSVFMIASYAMLFFANTVVSVIVCGLVLGLALSAWNISAICYLSEIGEKNKTEGLVLGVYSSLSYIGASLGYVALGYLASFISTRAIFLIYGIFAFLLVIISGRLLVRTAK